MENVGNIAVVREYLRCLEIGRVDLITHLFTSDAHVNSPLYGKIPATKFYKDLFNDTQKSKITLLHILNSVDDPTVCAGYFKYDWVLKDGTPTSFECVDIFKFERDKIKELTIIYDTAGIRSAFVDMKIS